MRYTGGIKRDGESIGRWCRRYIGISRRDERRSHFRFHQCLRQLRVEPLSTYLEGGERRRRLSRGHSDTIYVSGLPPFDPATGEVVNAPIERQTELVLEQMKLCLETAGWGPEHGLK